MTKEIPNGWEVTEFKCPVCKSFMFSVPDPLTGVKVGGFTIWCGQSNEVCSAQDVSGHAKNVKEAYEIVKQKFVARADR